MSEVGQIRDPRRISERGMVDEVPIPYWKRAHRDWKFWVALLFMLAAIAIYVLSDDLALLPH